jgi:hypothetical protein
VEVLHGLATVLAVGVVVVHVGAHRARPVERDQGADVVEAVRIHRPQQLPHRWRLELEHADRVTATEQVEREPIVEWDRVDVELGIA